MNLPDFQVLIGQELHDDLKPYVEEAPFGKMLRHPLVYQVPLGITGYANLYYEQKLKDVKDALDGRSIKPMFGCMSAHIDLKHLARLSIY
jgi:hypothetical protein